MFQVSWITKIPTLLSPACVTHAILHIDFVQVYKWASKTLFDLSLLKWCQAHMGAEAKNSMQLKTFLVILHTFWFSLVKKSQEEYFWVTKGFTLGCLAKLRTLSHLWRVADLKNIIHGWSFIPSKKQKHWEKLLGKLQVHYVDGKYWSIHTGAK